MNNDWHGVRMQGALLGAEIVCEVSACGLPCFPMLPLIETHSIHDCGNPHKDGHHGKSYRQNKSGAHGKAPLHEGILMKHNISMIRPNANNDAYPVFTHKD